MIEVRGEKPYPFHAVCGGDLAEHGFVIENSNIWHVGELRVVSGSTEVGLALRHSQSVQFGGGGRLRRRRSRRGGLRADSGGCGTTGGGSL